MALTQMAPRQWLKKTSVVLMRSRFDEITMNAPELTRFRAWKFRQPIEYFSISAVINETKASSI